MLNFEDIAKLLTQARQLLEGMERVIFTCFNNDSWFAIHIENDFGDTNYRITFYDSEFPEDFQIDNIMASLNVLRNVNEIRFPIKET